MTLQEAQELSERKWQCIIDHDGSDCDIDTLIPELQNMEHECAMCEFILNQENLKCELCSYWYICGNPYSNYISDPNTHTARGILNAIKNANIGIIEK